MEDMLIKKIKGGLLGIKQKTKDYGIVVYNNYAKNPNDIYYALKIPNMYNIKYRLQF